jgi:diaminopimelate decarboxylase
VLAPKGEATFTFYLSPFTFHLFPFTAGRYTARGTMEYRSSTLHIGETSALDLASRFGTPLYVYDAGVLRAQIASVRDAFAGLPFRPFYAMKANSNVSILRLVHEQGFRCDAVSPGEVQLALRAGFAPDEIWFTCSNVSDEDLRAIPASSSTSTRCRRSTAVSRSI